MKTKKHRGLRLNGEIAAARPSASRRGSNQKVKIKVKIYLLESVIFYHE